MNEFREFLKEYKIVGLAVGFIMGGATTTLVQSLVNDIVMPLLNPFLPAGGWQEATLIFGTITIRYGAFLGAFLNFFILALIVFLVAKKLLKHS